MKNLNATKLSDAFMNHLMTYSKIESYKKGEIMLSPGNTESRAWFIKNGIAKIFTYREDQSQIISCFLKENEVLTCVDSFFGNQSTENYIEALEDLTVYTITKAKFEKCSLQIKEVNEIALDILVDYAFKSSQRANLLDLPENSRYNEFMKQFNTARLPISDLCSFLCLSPSYLHKRKSCN